MNASTLADLNRELAAKSVGLEQFLVYSAALIRVYGYTSNKIAKEQGKESTGQLAWLWATKGKDHDSLMAVQINYEDRATAKETFEWLKNLDAKKCGMNDYLITLSGLAIAGTVVQKYTGFAASAIGAYQRDTGRSNEPKQGNFLGKVGEKISLPLIFKGAENFDSKFGICFKYLFEDSQGNKLSWLTSKNPSELNMTMGNTYQVSGTVKKLSEWKGVRQTELTRCSVRK